MILQRPKAQEDGEFGDIHSLQVSYVFELRQICEG